MTKNALCRVLLGNRNLRPILDCPGGTFPGAGIKTVVLFFEKGVPTKNIYQLEPGRSLGKTNPINDDDLADFVTDRPVSRRRSSPGA